jgi:hypothetical protein
MAIDNEGLVCKAGLENTQWGASNDALRLLFTSQELDRESGLYYYGARLYDATSEALTDRVLLYNYIIMQKYVSTNVHIPQALWKAVKIFAAQEGRSMRDLILEGLSLALRKQKAHSEKGSPAKLLLRFAGKAPSSVTDGSTEHDRYLYE